MSTEKPIALVSLAVAMDRLSIGSTKLYELIDGGTIETVKIGRRRLVLEPSLDAYIESLRT